MANDINGELRNVLPGNIDYWNRVYATVAEANAAIPSTVVGSRNFREGKVVQIGTVTDHKEYRWIGGFEDSHLKEYFAIPENIATKDDVSIISDSLPKSFINKAAPPVQNGYYRTTEDIGGFFSSPSYYSYTLLLSSYQPPIYVTGKLKDSGTALAFYYDEFDNLLSYEFRGTNAEVSYNKQILTIPFGTAKINITVLASGGPVQIFSEKINVIEFSDTVNEVFNSLPKDMEQIAFISPPLDGFLRSDNGGFTSTAAYKTYYLENFPENVYVSGTVKDAGTALAFYYNSANQFISYEFRGTANNVVYNKQKLTIPAGTVKIGISVLTAGGAAQAFREILSPNILSQTAGDARYPTKAIADSSYISLSRIPAVPLPSSDINYNNINFTDLTSFVGDTSVAKYVNTANRITKGGVTLKRVRVKVEVNTNLVIIAVMITNQNGVITVTPLHQYQNIPAFPGVEEYNISDSYVLPIGCDLAIGDTTGRLYYNGTGGAGYRLNANATSGTTSTVRVAFNFTTSDSYADSSPILTETSASNKYQEKSNGSSNILTKSQKQVKIKLSASDKILLYGTSISSTDYPWYKESMEQLTGSIVYNGGFSGATSYTLARNLNLQRIWDYAANLVVIEMGANDSGAPGTVGTFGAISGETLVSETDINVDYNGTYFIQAVSHVIRKFKAMYENIRVRANLTGTETEAEKTAKIDAVLKPYLVFSTGLPQKRNNSSDPFSIASNWIRKRDAIVECCNKYNIHCIDVMNTIGWNMDIEPYWVSPTNKINNNGVKTMDGLHPNKYGYYDMAQVVCGGIGII